MMEGNLFDFEIPEGGQYPREYETTLCEECGEHRKNWRGIKRHHAFFSKAGKYEYANLTCTACGYIVAWFRVRLLIN